MSTVHVLGSNWSRRPGYTVHRALLLLPPRPLGSNFDHFPVCNWSQRGPERLERALFSRQASRKAPLMADELRCVAAMVETVCKLQGDHSASGTDELAWPEVAPARSLQCARSRPRCAEQSVALAPALRRLHQGPRPERQVPSDDSGECA